MGIIDTHSHVTCERLVGRIDEIVANAKAHNIEKILIVCCSESEARLAIQAAEKYDIFDCAFGYHPENVDEISEHDFEVLEEILANPHMVALGEIGLDYYWVSDNKEKQKELFIRQIQLANQLQLPILVHMRDATQDTIEILKQNPCIGIMHCYSGSAETSKILLKMGFYLSFAGPLTFKNAKDAPEVCRQAPIDRIFVETDAPYLTPHPFRGKENEPAYVHLTFEKVCEIKEMEPQILMDQMKENYRLLFTKSNL